ncbi:hypothetical protein RD792_009444 [Penstemon davidsonii]|uniref:Uncharacterized protein n=1 Tax=Penstemon davidsonii TaxID=160366 RepID=A0ABR0CZ20_9LAMI|nr:hypothetical protein RD792_009444 [Penstemon davidsonii]
MEGVSGGVPMICRPIFADQMVNSRYLINEWRVGIELENAEDRTIVKNAIRRLLVDEEGKEMRQRCQEMKQKLEICVQEGGSSYNSLENLTQFILSM